MNYVFPNFGGKLLTDGCGNNNSDNANKKENQCWGGGNERGTRAETIRAKFLI